MHRALIILHMIALVMIALVPSAAAAGAGKTASSAAEVRETAVAVDTDDEARQLAENYLKTISHKGSEQAIERLLGGATMAARIFDLDNYRIVGREKHRHEEGDLADLRGHIEAIDLAGRRAYARVMAKHRGSSGSDELDIRTLDPNNASKLLEPTKAQAAAFTKGHPVFAYIARVDKHVYWHPKNPFRKLLADAGTSGSYQADIDLFWVETVEKLYDDETVRKWPLRVVRFQANSVDTGLKVLPAANWNAE